MNLRPQIFVAALVIMGLSALAAQQTPDSSSSKHANPEQHTKREAQDSDLAEKVYRNATYGLSFKIPYAWVERTREMQADEEDAHKGDVALGKVLLAVFERPPEATGNSVNSAVVIAEEPASAYPGIKSAADYAGPISELATSQGFKPVEQPYDIAIGAKPLVRCDFSRDLGKLVMRQSTLILMQKQAIVSFTFIGGSADEVEQLIDGLSFGAARPSASKK